MGTWNEQQIAGHRCELFSPASPSPSNFTLIYLHDLDQQGIQGRAPYEERFEKYGLRAIVPYTARSWWSDKLCSEFDPSYSAEKFLLNKIVPWIDSSWDAQPPRIGLLGVGMGGQGGLRLSFKYPDTFPLVAAITPFIDHQWCWQDPHSLLDQMYQNQEAVRQDTATLHIHPLYWPRNIWFCANASGTDWLESAQRLRMKLSALGIPHEVDLETAIDGTATDYEEHMVPLAIDFLAARLAQEERRVQ